jgi:hypothetical protein
MRKILILGCSHSLGSFKPSGTNEEYLAHEYGWWSFVDSIQDDKKIIFAGAGLSWMFWSYLIYSKFVNINDYDFCIIQDTANGRMSLLDVNWKNKLKIKSLSKNIEWHGLLHPSESNIIINNANAMINIIRKFSLTKKLETLYKFCEAIINSPTNDLAYITHRNWLLEKFQQQKIPVFIFNMEQDNIDSIPYGQKLGCNGFIYRLRQYRTFHSGHFTEIGNQKVGNAVNKELSNYVN